MKFRMILVAGLALAAAGDAGAQSGSELSVRPDGAVKEVPADRWPQLDGKAPAAPPVKVEKPAAAPANVAEAQALLRQVAQAHSAVEAQAAKPPPPKIETKAGVNELINIGLGSLNRLRTNFVDPDIRTVSDAMIQAEGAVIYVSSNTTDAITLFVHEGGRPDQAMSLTLLPRGIAPIDIEVTLAGYEPVSLPVKREVAEKWEIGQPYVSTISEIMNTLANGQVPTGYGLERLTHPMHPLMPHCRFGGAITTPSQALTGSNFVVLVARVNNPTAHTITLDESQCMQDGVRGVAAWPRLELYPGQETELYVVVERPAERIAGRERPPVIGARP